METKEPLEPAGAKGAQAESPDAGHAARRGPFPAAALRTAVALACTAFMFTNTNASIYPALAIHFPLIREGATIFAVAVTAVLVIVSCKWPRKLHTTALNGAALVASVAYVACCWAGLSLLDPVLLTVGTFCDSFAESWLFVLACTAFAQLSEKERSVVASGACLVAAVLGGFAPQLSYRAAVAAGGLCLLAIFFCSWGIARKNLADAAAFVTRAEASVANPFSFLPLNHLMFITILFFSFAQGISLSLVDMPLVQSTLNLAPVPLAALFVVPFITKRPLNADALFSICALLALAGMFLIPSTHTLAPSLASAAGALLDASYGCFYLLLLLITGSVIARNKMAAITTSALVVGLTWAGVGLGATLGHVCLAAVGADVRALTWLSLALAMAFATYCFVALKQFSFKDAIIGIKTVQPVQQPSVSAPTMQALCGHVASTFGLTKREEEVCQLLASGRNVGIICEKLGISVNTARYHAKNVYTKLGVHSQQELIDLVESFDAPPAP